MYKLLAIDLDDTLLNDEGTISEINKTAIRRAENDGVRVVIVSGRSYASTKQYIQELELPSLTVSLNGAYIHDPVNNLIVAGFPIDKQITQQIIKDMKADRIHVNFYCEDRVFCRKPTEEALIYSKMNRIEIDYVDSLEELSSTEQAGKLLLYDKPERLKRIQDQLRKKYGDFLNITFSKPFFLEMTALNATKGAALLKLADIYGIEPMDVMAIGDSENDLSMIRSAGLGIAAGNARKAIRDEADYVTRSNNDNGVAYAIEKFIINGEHG